jgi:hypothetical protein
VSVKTGEIIWLFKIEDMIEVPERCIRLFVPIAKKNAKFLSNPEKIVRCIAGTVFPSIKIAVAKKMFWPGVRLAIRRNLRISNWLPDVCPTDVCYIFCGEKYSGLHGNV